MNSGVVRDIFNVSQLLADICFLLGAQVVSCLAFGSLFTLAPRSFDGTHFSVFKSSLVFRHQQNVAGSSYKSHTSHLNSALSPESSFLLRHLCFIFNNLLNYKSIFSSRKVQKKHNRVKKQKKQSYHFKGATDSILIYSFPDLWQWNSTLSKSHCACKLIYCIFHLKKNVHDSFPVLLKKLTQASF